MTKALDSPRSGPRQGGSHRPTRLEVRTATRSKEEGADSGSGSGSQRQQPKWRGNKPGTLPGEQANDVNAANRNGKRANDNLDGPRCGSGRNEGGQESKQKKRCSLPDDHDLGISMRVCSSFSVSECVVNGKERKEKVGKKKARLTEFCRYCRGSVEICKVWEKKGPLPAWCMRECGMRCVAAVRAKA